MGKLKVLVAEAFTSQPYRSNMTGIISSATGLDDDQMQLLAREFRMEFGYLLPSIQSDVDYKLRFFTPRAEVPFSGHVTIAAFASLADEGLIDVPRKGLRILRVETEAGILTIQSRVRSYVSAQRCSSVAASMS